MAKFKEHFIENITQIVNTEIEQAKEKLDQWQKEFSDADGYGKVHCFVWGNETMYQAARLELYNDIKNSLEKTKDKEELLEYLPNYFVKELISKARSIAPSSSSPTSNLMKTYQTEVLAKLIDRYIEF